MAYYDKRFDKGNGSGGKWVPQEKRGGYDSNGGKREGTAPRGQRREGGDGQRRESYGAYPAQGDAPRKPRRNDERFAQPGGERRPYGGSNGERRPYGGSNDERRPYGGSNDERRPYGERRKPAIRREDMPRRDFGDRLPREARPAMPPREARPVPPRPAQPPRELPPRAVPFTEPPREPALPPENIIVGRNPIREAIRAGRDFEHLLVAKGELTGSAREIVMMAREKRIVVQTVDRARLDAIAPNHQGMIAVSSAFRYAELEDMFALAAERGEEPLLVILDGVTDPQNLGAVIRSAECVGAHGVIVPERRAVGLTPSAVKASAGAVEYLPVARAGNLTRLLEELKKRGLWIIAADARGETYTSMSLTGPLALVIGSEGEGVSRLVLEHCDARAALPMRGHIDSLNASVAAGILLYEVRRQRG